MPLEPIQLFFACDEKYLPLFGVALSSLKKNRDTRRIYEVYLLHAGLKEESVAHLRDQFNEEGFHLSFTDVSPQIESLSHRLHTRDYYSKTTYYRLFIPSMFPSLEKALYLDCDVILTGNVAELYDTPLDGALVGAVADGFVNYVPILRRYVENCVGVSPEQPYFNAGVLLMNLAKMREIDFEGRFLSLLSDVTYRVAQDQDYLNAICGASARFLSDEWNYMPFEERDSLPSLIHYNLDRKPWQTDGIPYAELFWDYADRSPFADEIHRMREGYTDADRERAAKETEGLIALAVKESEDEEANARIAACIDKVKEVFCSELK